MDINNIIFDGNDELLLYEILPFLDVVSLVEKKAINRKWKNLCEKTIDLKRTSRGQQQTFQNNEELYNAVRKYVEYSPVNMEQIATTYGYPIGKWDVSNIQDFSEIFECCTEFNEDIGEWDVSNATDMSCMFNGARKFNQDISCWDVSNVTNMYSMFWGARTFNQNLSAWNVSNVTNMKWMFEQAVRFDQDLSSWDISNVI